jgi:hypothetical protein
VAPEHILNIYISAMNKDLVHIAEMARCYVPSAENNYKMVWNNLKISQAPRNPSLAIGGLD